jgi:hypothetical protein
VTRAQMAAELARIRDCTAGTSDSTAAMIYSLAVVLLALVAEEAIR